MIIKLSDVRPYFKVKQEYDNPLANVSILPLPGLQYQLITSSVFHFQA